MRPIAVGGTLHRLVANCAVLHALEDIPQILSPRQLGFGVPWGVDAAVHVHTSRIYLHNLKQHQLMMKIDFKNAFNAVLRDRMLDAVREFIPDLLPFVHSAYGSSSGLLWGEYVIDPSEGVQQGDHSDLSFSV